MFPCGCRMEQYVTFTPRSSQCCLKRWLSNVEIMDSVANEKLLGKLSTLSRTPPVNIEFQDINYSAPGGDCKQILKAINGKFRAGELTAILGPSGSGKTTLLNILAGYIMNGVTGSISVNNRPRQMNIFHKISAYIMQEDLLQPHLTVKESVKIAARLKLGCNINVQSTVVEEVLNLLGLENCLDTRVENISGGQRKRLSIALEMVSNPPVIFLDEPTSGLDTVAIKQCIDVLTTLTGQGRTIVCTIHQPSVAIFQQFQQVYFMADGKCVYNGSTSNVISFLSSVGLECPTTYSPAEYIIETVQTSQEFAPVLVNAIQNGKLNRRDINQSSLTKTSSGYIVYEETTQLLDTTLNVNFATSFWMQLYILLGRMMLQMKRNKLVLWIQLFHHTLSGALFGILFYGIGNDAGMALANFKFCMSVMVFFVYTYLMSPVLLFPFEVAILKREYFNRWYSLKAYYVALTLRSIPLLMILGLTFILITYLLTNQPMEVSRFIWFATASILVGVASEGLGLAIGAIFNVTNGSIVAPAIAAPCLFLCVYGMGYGTAIEPYMKIIMSTSYLRYALVAISHAIFENREPFECFDEIYCHYKDPKHLLRDLGILDASFYLQMLGLICFMLLFRLIAYFALRFRLTTDFSYKILNYTTKILRHR